MKEYDYLIVGAGLAGAVLAERLASQSGKKVLLIDKRPHIGGNCYDFTDDAGVLVHKYGPHYFRTDYDDVLEYLSNFTEWHPHEYQVRIRTQGKLYSFPVNLNTLEEFFGRKFTAEEAEAFLETLKDKTIEEPKDAEEQVLKNIGKELYEAFFKGYTEKQWGMSAKELEPSVTARIPIRTNRDQRYVPGKHQCMPKEGYTKMFEKMLSHQNITVKTSMAFNSEMRELADRIIWTGCIDEFYGFRHGRLPYRSLEFTFVSAFGKEFVQEFGQINYPDKDVPYTRIVEIKHVTGQKCPNTTISIEHPRSEGEPYYPVPNSMNTKLYEKYLEDAKKEKDVYFIGRLAQYRYLNMDQVVKSALDFFEEIKNE